MKNTIRFADLPETLTPNDYAKWRGIGLNKAREKFNAKGFPRIEGMGTKLIADKRAVLMFDLGLSEIDAKYIYENVAKEIASDLIAESEDEDERETEG